VRHRLEHDKLKVFDTCTNLIREFQSWKFKTDKEGLVAPGTEMFERGNNHLLDALRGIVADHPAFHRQGLEYTDDPEYAARSEDDQ
jgi:hypothetical protein